MFIHHIVTILVASILLFRKLLMCYGSFFFGVSELSSIPLIVVDHFHDLANPRKGGSRALEKLNNTSRVMFAVFFLLIRCVYWPYVARLCNSDILDMMSNKRYSVWMMDIECHMVRFVLY